MLHTVIVLHHTGTQRVDDTLSGLSVGEDIVISFHFFYRYMLMKVKLS